MSRPREINCLRHPITSRQALGMLMECWAENRLLPVMLITARRDSEDMVSRIRATLSKERNLIPSGNSSAAYGFTTSEPFPCRVHKQMGEAIIIRFRMTVAQSIMNNAEFILGRIQS